MSGLPLLLAQASDEPVRIRHHGSPLLLELVGGEEGADAAGVDAGGRGERARGEEQLPDLGELLLLVHGAGDLLAAAADDDDRTVVERSGHSDVVPEEVGLPALQPATRDARRVVGVAPVEEDRAVR